MFNMFMVMVSVAPCKR